MSYTSPPRLLSAADLLFTLPSVLLLLMNGFVMVFARWGGWGALPPIVLDNCRLGTFHCVRRNMGGDAYSRPTSHGCVL